jgi:crossover junction endodeoxyribonuclease RuvC
MDGPVTQPKHRIPEPLSSPGRLRRVAGVDPGLTVTGYAVLEGYLLDGNGQMGVEPRRWTICEAGVIRPVPGESLESRLEQLYLALQELLQEFRPEAVVVEALHSRYRHPGTAILMAHARGVLCLAAAQEAIPVVSFPPSVVKQCVAGTGRADKHQVARALCRQLALPTISRPSDVNDALALALCWFLRPSSPTNPPLGSSLRDR